MSFITFQLNDVMEVSINPKSITFFHPDYSQGTNKTVIHFIGKDEVTVFEPYDEIKQKLGTE